MTRSRQARPAPEVLLERRYRRLLAWYPAGYRAASEEEMLGVALARAAPGQRWPGLGETVSLVVSGIRLRLRWLLNDLRTDAWGDAAVLFGTIGPVLITTIYAESLSSAAAPGLTGVPERLSFSAIMLAAGWSLVAVAALLRWRWAAAAGASLGVLCEAVFLAVHYGSNPSYLVVSWWQFMLAMLAALAAVIALARPKTRHRPLSWPVITTVVAAAAVLAAFPLAQAAFTTVIKYPDGAAVASSPLFGIEGLLRIGLHAVLALAVLIAITRLPAAARRRALVLAFPVAAVAALVGWTFRGYLTASSLSAHPVLLTVLQWAALGTVPMLALAAGIAMLSRHERSLRQVHDAGAAGQAGPPAP
jgi:hypothetical protein